MEVRVWAFTGLYPAQKSLLRGNFWCRLVLARSGVDLGAQSGNGCSLCNSLVTAELCPYFGAVFKGCKGVWKELR